MALEEVGLKVQKTLENHPKIGPITLPPRLSSTPPRRKSLISGGVSGAPRPQELKNAPKNTNKKLTKRRPG